MMWLFRVQVPADGELAVQDQPVYGGGGPPALRDWAGEVAGGAHQDPPHTHLHLPHQQEGLPRPLPTISGRSKQW